jgi:hypothetical protein
MMVAMEYFTKWPIVRAVEKADQESMAKFLYEEIYAQFGPPAEFLTDNGTHFDNITMANFCAMARNQAQALCPLTPADQWVGRKVQWNLDQSTEEARVGLSP